MRETVRRTIAEDAARRKTKKAELSGPIGVDGIAAAVAALGAEQLAELEARAARGDLTSADRKILEAARNRSP